jgi:hypothetical protein
VLDLLVELVRRLACLPIYHSRVILVSRPKPPF